MRQEKTRIKEYYRADASSDPTAFAGRTGDEWTRDGMEAMFFETKVAAKELAASLPIGSRPEPLSAAKRPPLPVKDKVVKLWVISRNAYNFRLRKRLPGVVSGSCELLPVATFATAREAAEYLATADYDQHAGGVEYHLTREKAFETKQVAATAAAGR